jgi:hypothetical protein
LLSCLLITSDALPQSLWAVLFHAEQLRTSEFESFILCSIVASACFTASWSPKPWITLCSNVGLSQSEMDVQNLHSTSTPSGIALQLDGAHNRSTGEKEQISCSLHFLLSCLLITSDALPQSLWAVTIICLFHAEQLRTAKFESFILCSIVASACFTASWSPKP